MLLLHVAMTTMREQKGVTSHVFNTVGSGVKGGGTPGYVTYGATKRGLPQMTESLVKEIEEGVQGYDEEDWPGKVNCRGTLSPGMVFTDLLLDDSTPELRKFPFGVLAALPETVAFRTSSPRRPRPRRASSTRTGEFLDNKRVLTKFYEKFVEGKPSEFVDDDGNVIKKPGARTYADNGVAKQY